MPQTPTVRTRSGAGRSLAAGTMPSIGLALGGGGARGLAHTVILEAFDDLGIRPKVVAGTSIGAIIGAAYASGLSGRDIRESMRETLSVRFDFMRDLFSARARRLPTLAGLFAPFNAVLSAEALLDIIYPAGVARDFADLQTPLKVVATDFYGLEPVVFTEGPLRRAVAASMALPALFEPMVVDGRALIDGGLTNPLPYDLLMGEAEIIIAIDVSGAPTPSPDRNHPSATEALFGASFIFERSIIREKLKSQRPDIYLNAGTSHFQLVDFWKVDEILAAAAPAKERLKTQLGRLLDAETLPEPLPNGFIAADGLADGLPEGYAGDLVPHTTPEPKRARRILFRPLRKARGKKPA